MFWGATFNTFLSNVLSTDSTYRFFFSTHEPPTMTELGQPVYVEVFVVKHQNEDLMLLLQDCWATPSNNPNDPQRWNLLIKGWMLMWITGTFLPFFYIQHFICWYLYHTCQSKLNHLSVPDVLSVVIPIELLCFQLSPVRSSSIRLFTSGLWSSCSHLWSPKHLKIWYVRFYSLNCWNLFSP